jgi:heme exporter protein A
VTEPPADAHDTAVLADDLALRFGPRWVLARLSFALPRGGACMITGANGSGKTTLLRCVATALKPHHGRLVVLGHDAWGQRRFVRRDVALLSHATRLWDDLDAAANLRTWARLAGLRADVPTLLDRVGLPADRREPVRTFSAGMRRRLALARVLLKRPRLLLLDEPFTALDPAGRTLVLDLLHALRADGTTLLLATHLPDVARAVCEDHLHMEAGRILESSLDHAREASRDRSPEASPGAPA